MLAEGNRPGHHRVARLPVGLEELQILPDDALEQFALFLRERHPHLPPATPEQRAQASLVMVAHNPCACSR